MKLVSLDERQELLLLAAVPRHEEVAATGLLLVSSLLWYPEESEEPDTTTHRVLPFLYSSPVEPVSLCTLFFTVPIFLSDKLLHLSKDIVLLDVGHSSTAFALSEPFNESSVDSGLDFPGAAGSLLLACAAWSGRGEVEFFAVQSAIKLVLPLGRDSSTLQSDICTV